MVTREPILFLTPCSMERDTYRPGTEWHLLKYDLGTGLADLTQI